jgi:hypothetical protein
MSNKQKVRVFWEDAVFYGTHDAIPDALSQMETIGFIERETDEYLIIKDPITLNLKKNINHPKEGNPTFYFIPRGMIIKTEIVG